MSENILQTPLAVYEKVESGALSGFAVLQVDLCRLDLIDRALLDVAFRNVNMEHVPAVNSTCRDVRFEACRLRGFNLASALMTGTRIMNCEAHEISMREACAIGLQVFDTPMANASFIGARLDDCLFQSADLYGAKFESALLTHCRFSDPRMENAGLNRVSFERAVLIDVDLRGANLHGANFKDALCVRVDFRDTNLVRAELEEASFVACDTTGSIR